MKDTFITAIGCFMALFLMSNGVLLIFWPLRFLRFYDFWNRGDTVGRNASWRKNVHAPEYKFLGLIFVVAAGLIVWALVRSG